MPVDAHGLSEDSLRGSEHYAVRAAAPAAELPFKPLSAHELAAADRASRTVVSQPTTFDNADRLPIAEGAASAGYTPTDPAQLDAGDPASPTNITTGDPADTSPQTATSDQNPANDSKPKGK